MVDYDFAPDLSNLRPNQIICVVVSPVCIDGEQGLHRVASIPSGIHCRFEGTLETGMASYSLLRVKVVETTQIPLLTMVEQSIVLGHPHPSWKDAHSVIELCAGMGALGQGAVNAGFQPVAACELRGTMASLYSQQNDIPVIVGDIREFSTVQTLHAAHSRCSVIAAGISCQPYSRLGDCKSGSDERAQTLPATLMCAHYLRALVVVLECVEPAARDAFVNWHVNQFCSRTGFHRTEAILKLSDVWPCKRTRWWCILSAPAIGPVNLPELPILFDLPSIQHVLPELQKWSIHDERQLRLTPVELEAFSQESGTVTKYLPNMKGVLPCALHAWGSQLLPCPCGCRTEGLSASRLLSKGLFGVLAPCLALLESPVDREQSQYRHLHPKETALLCGLDPVLTWSSNLRLTLGAVGQLASPVHANWVFNHIRHVLKKSQFGVSDVQPVAELRAYRAWLLARAQQIWHFDETKCVPSEAWELSLSWKPRANLNMIDLLAEGDSLDKTLRELVDSQTVVTGSEMGSVTDLTATQIAIPSQEEPQEVSPTSEVQSEVLHHEFSCRLIVATGDPLQDSDSIIQVRGPATVNEVVQAEIAIAKWQHVEFQCWSEGEVIDMHSSLKPDMVLSLVVVSEFTSQLDHNSSGEEPELQVVASDEVNHPLTQIKGKAFLNMLPPQVTKVSQAEALRSQKISSHDRSKVLLNQEL